MMSWIDECRRLVAESIQCFPSAVVNIISDYVGEQVMIILQFHKNGIANSVFLVERNQWSDVLNRFWHLYRITPVQIADSLWDNVENYYETSIDDVFEESKMITDAVQIEQFRTLPYVLIEGGEHYIGAIAAPFTKMARVINREYYNQGYLVCDPDRVERDDSLRWVMQRAEYVINLLHKLYSEYKGPQIQAAEAICGEMTPMQKLGVPIGGRSPRPKYYGFYISYNSSLGRFEYDDSENYRHFLYRIKMLLSFLDPQDDNPLVQEIFRESRDLQEVGLLNYTFDKDTINWIKLHGGNVEEHSTIMKRCDNPVCKFMAYDKLCISCRMWQRIMDDYAEKQRSSA